MSVVRAQERSATQTAAHATTSSAHAAVKRGQRAAHPAPKRPLSKMQSVHGVQTYIAGIEARTEHEAGAEHEAKAEHEGRTERAKSSNRVAVGGRPADDKEAGVDYLQAYLFYLRQRAFPKDTIDPNTERLALLHRAHMAAATGIGHHGNLQSGRGGPHPHSIGSPNHWQFLGPNNLGVPYRTYYGTGPISGRVNAVAYDPASPGVYYVGTASGGVWKTTDSGVHWKSLSDAWPELYVSSLAIDPTNTNIVYAGTGDYDGYRGNGIGIMKSMDGGQTWSKITPAATDPNNTATGMDGFGISSILIDPEDHNILTATLGRDANWWAYVWRSTDGGQTWNSVINTLWAPWSGLSCGAKDASGQRYYYATAPYDSYYVGNTGVDDGAIVYRSADRGATWTKLTLPAGLEGSDSEIKVAASHNFPGTLYLLDAQNQKIWKSADAGTTWSDTTHNFSADWGQADYDKHIECGAVTVQGKAQDVVYVGLIDLLDSLDGGQTWQSIGGPTTTDNALTHNDQHTLTINPANTSELLIGNDGGVYRLTLNAANNPTYASLNANLGITQFYHADWHPADPNQMLGGTQDNATPASLGDLTHWPGEGGGDGAGCAINPLAPATQFASVDSYAKDNNNNGYIYRTDDDWTTQSYPSVNFGSDPVAFIPPLTIDPSTPNNIYLATSYLYLYQADIDSWTSQVGGQQLASNGGYVQCIAVAPTDSNRIYTGSSDGQVWMTTDSGNTWNRIDNTGTSTLPIRSVTSIVVSPTNSGSILVGLSGSGAPHLWAAPDTLGLLTAGSGWISVSGAGANALPDISLNTIAVDVDDPMNTYYVGTDIGVFQTTNGGTAWQNATAALGLPNTFVSEIKAVPGTRFLNVATYGRGMWHIKLNTNVVSVVTNPTAVVGGTVVTGTVTITDPAPAGGFTVGLSSDTPKVAAPAQSTVVVPSGQTTATFAIKTHMPINPASVTAAISASANGLTQTTALTVQNIATPHFMMTAAFTRSGNSIVATITLTNNGAVAANAVQIKTSMLLDKQTGKTTAGSGLPLSFGDLAAGAANTLKVTFPAGAGATGDLSLLRVSGSYQQAAPATGAGSFNSGQQQYLP